MKIGEAKEFYLVGKGVAPEEFVISSDKTTDDVLAAWRHNDLKEVEYMQTEIRRMYIMRGETVPLLPVVRVIFATVATLSLP